MSAADVFFGTSPSASTTSVGLMTPEQQAALSKSITEAMNGPLTPSAAYTPYSGTLTAPTSSLQNMSLSAIEAQVMNEATGGPGSNKAAQQEIDRIIRSGGSPVDVSSAYSSYADPVIRDFNDRIVPGLQSTFSGSSAFGSDKLKQQQLLTNDLTRNLVNKSGDLTYQAQNDAKNRLMTALGMVPQLGAATTSKLNSGLAAGSVPQQTQQADLTAKYTDFLRGQTAGQSTIAQLMNLITQQSIKPVTTVTPGSQGIAGQMASILTAMMMQGGGAGGPGAAGGIGGGISSTISSIINKLLGGSNISNIPFPGGTIKTDFSGVTGNVFDSTVNPTGLDTGVLPAPADFIAPATDATIPGLTATSTADTFANFAQPGGMTTLADGTQIPDAVMAAIGTGLGNIDPAIMAALTAGGVDLSSLSSFGYNMAGDLTGTVASGGGFLDSIMSSIFGGGLSDAFVGMSPEELALLGI